MELRKTVVTILDVIPGGVMFDSHFVVEQLIRNHSDEYIRFCSKYLKAEAITLRAHQGIGQVIKSFAGDLVKKQDTPSYSRNIHGNAK